MVSLPVCIWNPCQAFGCTSWKGSGPAVRSPLSRNISHLAGHSFSSVHSVSQLWVSPGCVSYVSHLFSHHFSTFWKIVEFVFQITNLIFFSVQFGYLSLQWISYLDNQVINSLDLFLGPSFFFLCHGSLPPLRWHVCDFSLRIPTEGCPSIFSACSPLLLVGVPPFPCSFFFEGRCELVSDVAGKRPSVVLGVSFCSLWGGLYPPNGQWE